MWSANYYSPYGNYSTSNYSINSYYSNYSNSFQPHEYDYRSISLNTHAIKPVTNQQQHQPHGFYYQISSVYQPPALDRNRQGSLHYKPVATLTGGGTSRRLTAYNLSSSPLAPFFHSNHRHMLTQSSASNLNQNNSSSSRSTQKRANKSLKLATTTNCLTTKKSSVTTTTTTATAATTKKSSASQQNKYARAPNLDKSQLYYKYQSQKKAEHDFYALQRQIAQTESLAANNPSMAGFYAAWLQQAKESLKQFTSIIESPDAVTFSVSYFLKIVFFLFL